MAAARLARAAQVEARRHASLAAVPDEILIDELVAAAYDLIQKSDSGIVNGDEVARSIGRDPAAGGLYDAFRAIEQRGLLQVGSWPDGIGLPGSVQLP
jgi:hypothetical protein